MLQWGFSHKGNYKVVSGADYDDPDPNVNGARVRNITLKMEENFHRKFTLAAMISNMTIQEWCMSALLKEASRTSKQENERPSSGTNHRIVLSTERS